MFRCEEESNMGHLFRLDETLDGRRLKHDVVEHLRLADPVNASLVSYLGLY